jgi:exodeoxyribonuclease VIII
MNHIPDVGKMADEVTYHDRPEVSATMLKSMARGWRTFEAEHVTKTAVREETDAMKLGTLIHAAILEPQEYDFRYCLMPENYLRLPTQTIKDMQQACRNHAIKGFSKMDKPELITTLRDHGIETYEDWARRTIGTREVVKPAHAKIVDEIRHRVFHHPMARTLLTAGRAEREWLWTTDGVDCRAKTDWTCGDVIVDVKTCQDARPEHFARDIAQRRYDLQAAHYLDGTKAQRFIFLAVETTVPFRVRCYSLFDADLAEARKDRAELLEEYQRRVAANDWSEPGENQLQTVFLPNYRGDR